ncbi:MAG: hypothetical protein ACRDZQ_11430 [Acidimicrobiales bacterium]
MLWAVVGLGVLLAAGGAVRAWGAATLPAGAPIRDLLPQVLQAAATPAVSCLLAAVASVFAASVLRRVGGYRSR